MDSRFLAVVAVGVMGVTLAAADGDRQIQVVTSKSTPTIDSVTLYHVKDGKRQSVAEIAKFDKPFALTDDGPFEIQAKPKGGQAITIAAGVAIKKGQTYDLKLGDLIGSVEVFGDNFPRADKIVLTDERDPGPGEKGHVAVQSATDYRVEMAVPPGFYSVWVVPANGAKSQRVVDRVRAMGGRNVRVGD